MEFTFLYTPAFVKEWNRQRLTDFDLQALEAGNCRRPGGATRDEGHRRPAENSMRPAFETYRQEWCDAGRICLLQNEVSDFRSRHVREKRCSQFHRSSARANRERAEDRRKELQVKRKKRNVGKEIIADLKELNATLRAGQPLREKYTVRTVRTVPEPAVYSAADVRHTRELVGVSQPVFSRMLGVSPALVRSWECGQRTPAPIARRLLDLIRANPSSWRELIKAA